MKVYNRIFMILGLTGLILSGCSKDDPAPSQKEKQLNKLSDTWVITSVTMDNGDVTSEYASFKLTLSGSADAAVFAYGVVGRPLLSPWPSGGTWSFGPTMGSQIMRDPGTVDEVDITYTITNTTLEMDFHFSGAGYQASKVNSAEGHWVFSFTKE